MKCTEVLAMPRAAPSPPKSSKAQTEEDGNEFGQFLEVCTKEEADQGPEATAGMQALMVAPLAALMLLQPAAAQPAVETAGEPGMVTPEPQPAPTGTVLPDLVVSPETTGAAVNNAAGDAQVGKAALAVDANGAGSFAQALEKTASSSADTQTGGEPAAAVPQPVQTAAQTSAPVAAPQTSRTAVQEVQVVEQPVTGKKTTQAGTTQEATSAYAAALTPTAETPLESKTVELVQRVSKEIGEMVRNGKSSLHLQVQPESMGRINLRLISNTEGMRVILTADNSSTSRLLENNLDQLQKALSSAGLQISGLSVGNQGVMGQNAGNTPGERWTSSKHPVFDINPLVNESQTERYQKISQISSFDYRV